MTLNKFIIKMMLEQTVLDKESDDKFLFRRIEKKDYDRGFYGVLGQLTKVGEVPREQFEK